MRKTALWKAPPHWTVREVLTQKTHTSCAALGSQTSCNQLAAAGRAGGVAGIAVKESKVLTAPLMKKVTAPSVLQCFNAGRASQ